MANFFSGILNFFSNSGNNLIDTIGDTVDRFVHTDEEKEKLKKELLKIKIEQQQNEQRFILELEKMRMEKEAQLEKSVQAQIDSKKELMLEELKQEDKYTKRARPTVIYMGLIFIFLELIGLRLVIFDSLDVDPKIIESSNNIFEWFMTAWASVIGIYSIGRTVEKKGLPIKWRTKRNITSQDTETKTEKEIKELIKDQIKW
ncbi:MAG: 3TM-type holin [Hyphomicrobiales bacterium]